MENLIRDSELPAKLRSHGICIFRKITAKPHLAGTEADYKQAKQMVDLWDELGFDTTKLQPYDVLLSYPDINNPNQIEVLDSNEEVVISTQLFEKILRPEMNQSDVVSPYNAFSATGEPKVRKHCIYSF